MIILKFIILNTGFNIKKKKMTEMVVILSVFFLVSLYVLLTGLKKNKKVLLIISGGIAAYKTLELIRLIKKNEAEVKCVATEAAPRPLLPGIRRGPKQDSATSMVPVKGVSCQTHWRILSRSSP